MKKLLILCFSLISISLFAQEIEDEKVLDAEEVFHFAVVEEIPVFPGCDDDVDSDENVTCFQKGVMNHIMRNFTYPELARKEGITEKIFVRFTIGKNGKVSDAKVIRGINKSLKEEALRLVNSIPEMKPAKLKGKPVAISYTIPIYFALN